MEPTWVAVPLLDSLGLPPHRANGLRNEKGELVPLSEEEHAKLATKIGSRGQIPGAIFTPDLQGFEPATQWECPIRAPSKKAGAPREHFLELGTANNGRPSRLYVRYPRRQDVNWSVGRRAAKALFASHNDTRNMDLMEGGMVGCGKHISRLGGALVDYASTDAYTSIAGYCGAVHSNFKQLFMGKEVGFEELPLLGGSKPPTWAVSENLGNPAHFDNKDGHRGYAQWFMDDPQATVTSWWFLLPEHGVAVELQDAAVKRFNEDEEGKTELRKRALPGGAPKEQLQFSEGEVALLYWLTKSEDKRFFEVTVKKVKADGTVVVIEPTGNGSFKETSLTKAMVNNYLAKRN